MVSFAKIKMHWSRMSMSEGGGERESETDRDTHIHTDRLKECVCVCQSAVNTEWQAMKAMKAVASAHTVSMCVCLHACAQVLQAHFWSRNKNCKSWTSLIKKVNNRMKIKVIVLRVVFRIKIIWKIFLISQFLYMPHFIWCHNVSDFQLNCGLKKKKKRKSSRGCKHRQWHFWTPQVCLLHKHTDVASIWARALGVKVPWV